jgi:hypothetical protein
MGVDQDGGHGDPLEQGIAGALMLHALAAAAPVPAAGFAGRLVEPAHEAHFFRYFGGTGVWSPSSASTIIAVP